MGEVIEQIKDQLAEFAKRYGPTAIVPAVVKAVNEDGTIAVEFADGSEIDDVRLKAIVKEGNQFLIFPKADSNVLIGRISDSEDFVLIAASEIEEVEIKIGGTLFSVKEKFVIKTETEDLLTLMTDLIEAMLAEKHMTNSGPTINLTPDSIAKYTALKTRFKTLLKTA